MSKVSLPILLPERQCGSCSKCCEGWLEATVHGQKMYPGQHCFFLEKGESGCAIYPQRPEKPCIEYSCAWIEEPNVFPSWLKPNLSNVIITKKTIDDTELTYYEVAEAGGKIDSSVLHWLFMWALKTQTSMMYQIDGKFHTLASPQLDAALAAIAAKK